MADADQHYFKKKQQKYNKGDGDVDGPNVSSR